ncbi:hypothetical protein CIB84_008435, partial [Bambusicola thoracicus]
YAEVRAEKRRDLGLEESSVELASSSVKQSVSFPATSSMRHTDTSTPTRPAVPEKAALRLAAAGSAQVGAAEGSRWRALVSPLEGSDPQLQAIATPPATGEHLPQQPAVPSQQAVMVRGVVQLLPKLGGREGVVLGLCDKQEHHGEYVLWDRPKPCSLSALQPVYHFPAPLGMMHQLKEQLEERTRILQADIKTQQEELHVIKEQLQLVQDSNLQMLMQQPIPLVFNNVQRQSPRRAPPPSRQPSTKKAPQPGPMAKHYGAPPVSTPRPFLREPCSTPSQVPQQQQHLMRGNQAQPTCLPGQTSISVPLYNNPTVFPQAQPVTVAAQLPTDVSERQMQSDYSQDRSLRTLLDQSIQALVPAANGSTQPTLSSASRQLGKFVAEQQPLPPATQMQPISGSTVRPPAPSPVFSPSVMLPHGSFVSHPGSTPLHLHPWPQQQVQQHRLYLQVRSVAVCRAGVGSEGSEEEIGLS